MALSPNVVVVAPGDLITAAHLNNVRANLDRLDTTKLSTAGGTLTGGIVVGGGVTVGAAPSATVPGVSITVGGRVWTAVDTDALQNFVFTRIGSPAGGTGQQFGSFNRGASACGSITVASATSIAFNTTSDPRAKTAAPQTRGIDSASSRVQAIGRNAWQGRHVDPDTGEPDGDTTWDFVSSHDVQDHAPYAVYGDRDAVDDTGAPVFQQVSYGDLVPLLFAALSDALDRIDALEAAA
jgi:hypothetical protein